MNDFTRRQFLKASLAAGAALPLAGLTGTAKADEGELPRRLLGKTGESVTILGLGAAHIAHNPNNTKAIVETTLDSGIRYIDTAPGYRESELNLGPLLKGVRDELFLATKIPKITFKEAEESLAASLKRLQTDRVDLLYIHGVGLHNFRDVKKILSDDGTLAFMRKAKRDGLARFIGYTTHPPYNYTLEMLEEFNDFDVAMHNVNYMVPATREKDMGDVIAASRKFGHGMVAMKVLGGNGQLAKDYDLSFRYALSVPGVASNCIGMKNVEEVQRAVKAAKEYRPLTQEEMKKAEEFGEQLVKERDGAFLQYQSHFARDFGIA